MMKERTVLEDEEDCDVVEEEVQRRLTAMRLLTNLEAMETLMEKARSELNALLMFPEAGEMREALRTVRRVEAEAECIVLGIEPEEDDPGDGRLRML